MKRVAQGIVVLLAVFAVIYAETSENVASDESILNSPKTNVAATPAEDEKEDKPAVALKEADEGRSVQLELS